MLRRSEQKNFHDSVFDISIVLISKTLDVFFPKRKEYFPIIFLNFH